MCHQVSDFLQDTALPALGIVVLGALAALVIAGVYKLIRY